MTSYRKFCTSCPGPAAQPPARLPALLAPSLPAAGSLLSRAPGAESAWRSARGSGQAQASRHARVLRRKGQLPNPHPPFYPGPNTSAATVGCWSGSQVQWQFTHTEPRSPPTCPVSEDSLSHPRTSLHTVLLPGRPPSPVGTGSHHSLRRPLSSPQTLRLPEIRSRWWGRH